MGGSRALMYMPIGMIILIQSQAVIQSRQIMKMRYGVLFIGVLAILTMAFMLSRRPSAKDFCFGTRSFKLSRIEFDGQGRYAILSDPAALVYLSSLPKLKALPVSIEITNGYELRHKIIRPMGTNWNVVQTFVGNDGSTLGFACLESLLGDANFSFVTTESNAPVMLQEVIRFLLEEENRGKRWTEAGVGPTN